MPVSALLFTTPQCPHCPGIKQALQILLQENAIAALEIVDATQQSERARVLGVQSVPWLQLGQLQFEGTMSLAELRYWAQAAGSPQGMHVYFLEMLKTGRRAKVEHLLRQHPQHAAVLGDLLLDPEASMAVRIGIGAVLEEFQGTDTLAAMVPSLTHVLQDQEPRNRADAAHYLSLIANPGALDALRNCLDDADPEIREIAQEALGEN